MEITEESKISKQILEQKQAIINRWNAQMALDDYGSGYNGEQTLLRIAPQFIKIDLNIIRNIDKDQDKQEIVVNIVSYAHERNMYIIAEGVETKEEFDMVESFGVDYVQGYYLGCATKIPVRVI